MNIPYKGISAARGGLRLLRFGMGILARIRSRRAKSHPISAKKKKECAHKTAILQGRKQRRQTHGQARRMMTKKQLLPWRIGIAVWRRYF